MRRLFSMLLCLFVCCDLFSQGFQFKLGDRLVCDDGSISYSSNVSILHLSDPFLQLNMVLRTGSPKDKYYIVITVPVSTLDNVPSGSILTLFFEGGDKLFLPIEGEAIWNESTAPPKKETEFYVMNIPYRVTESQISRLSRTVVRKITIEGKITTLNVSLSGAVFQNIVKRQYQEIQNMKRL